MSIPISLNSAIRENWILASRKLNFEIISPFKFNFNNREKVVFAFLPAYGSDKGMIVDLIGPLEFQTDDEVRDWTKSNGYYCSFVNAEQVLTYDETWFVGALEDWGNYKR